VNRNDDDRDDQREMQESDQEGYLRFEAARTAELFAKASGHPENAPAIERTLLTVAELPFQPERNEDQQELFAA
jgi:hypothetical protein